METTFWEVPVSCDEAKEGAKMVFPKDGYMPSCASVVCRYLTNLKSVHQVKATEQVNGPYSQADCGVFQLAIYEMPLV